jgi:hypothetical protein
MVWRRLLPWGSGMWDAGGGGMLVVPDVSSGGMWVVTGCGMDVGGRGRVAVTGYGRREIQAAEGCERRGDGLWDVGGARCERRRNLSGGR